MSKFDEMMKKLTELDERAKHATDAGELLKISAERAVAVGVPKEKVLWSIEDVDRYFLDD